MPYQRSKLSGLPLPPVIRSEKKSSSDTINSLKQKWDVVNQSLEFSQTSLEGEAPTEIVIDEDVRYEL